MYDLYILYSERVDQYYVGHTKNLEERLQRHNAGKSLSTKKGIPWKFKTSITFESRSRAMKAEKWVKNMKSRKVIEKLISGELDVKEIVH